MEMANKTIKHYKHTNEFPYSLASEQKIKCSISSNKRRASNNRFPLINDAPLGIHIEISASL